MILADSSIDDELSPLPINLNGGEKRWQRYEYAHGVHTHPQKNN